LKNRNNYKRFLFPFLSRIDPETAHGAAVALLSFVQDRRLGHTILSHITGEIPSRPVQLFGLTFPNVLGVAAGFDKEGTVAQGLANLGFGHVEIGTITPFPQEGNPRPRIFRLPKDGALINRMGFPSLGVEKAILRFDSSTRLNYIRGISLGKQKETPLETAVDDYIFALRGVLPFADYLAINISSPNTPELRQLQGRKYLGELLGTLTAENKSAAMQLDLRRRPLLVKIAPDLTFSELDEMLQIILDNQVDGVIATNTTIHRDALKDKNRHERGGLSGVPLASRSTEIVRHIAKVTTNQLPIIGVGGIASANDVKEKLDAGASLVQLYTALIYEGPGLAGRILRELN
jgi:dihydroorotate dehydrogenase